MNVRDLIPWGRSTNQAPILYRDEQASPFLTLHREMNRLFDEALRSFAAPSLFERLPSWPNVEISETDKELRVSAEVPGLEEKDVEVLLSDDVLTIRGEKKSEVEVASDVTQEHTVPQEPKLGIDRRKRRRSIRQLAHAEGP